jgi:GTP-dependent phosphoenolpyruvate carboxykinase
MEVGEIETILAYVDDVVFLGNSKNEVDQTTIKFLEAGKIMSLEVNQKKTKYMCI